MAILPPEERAPTPNRCDNCYAYLEDPRTTGKGWCRLNPPQVLLRAPVGTSTRYDAQSHWPDVNAEDWCAQWKSG